MFMYVVDDEGLIDGFLRRRGACCLYIPIVIGTYSGAYLLYRYCCYCCSYCFLKERKREGRKFDMVLMLV
jgi:hypothetical protein